MKKVLIIGSSGAGKSTFSRRLHQTTNLPLIHLDRLYWKPNWVETIDKDEWKQTIENALHGGAWILDGNYSGTLEMRLEKCDTVIFLDLPRLICVYRILKRVAFYRKGSRPDMADGCDEQFDWEFLKIVWNYPTRSKPKVEALLKRFENKKTIFSLRSKKEIEDFFVNLQSDAVNSL